MLNLSLARYEIRDDTENLRLRLQRLYAYGQRHCYPRSRRLKVMIDGTGSWKRWTSVSGAEYSILCGTTTHIQTNTFSLLAPRLIVSITLIYSTSFLQNSIKLFGIL